MMEGFLIFTNEIISRRSRVQKIQTYPRLEAFLHGITSPNRDINKKASAGCKNPWRL